MVSYNVDAMIYSALASVDLASSYFVSYGEPKPEDIENLRDEFNWARRFVLAENTGHWSFKTLTLPVNPSLDDGWYHIPSDCIAWYRPVPKNQSTDINGVPIVKLGGNNVTYIFDREDMSGMPIQLQELVKMHFLWKLLPRAVISPQKTALILQNLQIMTRSVKELCAIDKQSKQRF